MSLDRPNRWITAAVGLGLEVGVAAEHRRRGVDLTARGDALPAGEVDRVGPGGVQIGAPSRMVLPAALRAVEPLVGSKTVLAGTSVPATASRKYQLPAVAAEAGPLAATSVKATTTISARREMDETGKQVMTGVHRKRGRRRVAAGPAVNREWLFAPERAPKLT